MIVVKIELWPGGNPVSARELGRTYIDNVGGSKDRGDYRVRVQRRGSSPSEYKQTRMGKVKDYPRLSYNVWRLVIRALKSAFPEEK